MLAALLFALSASPALPDLSVWRKPDARGRSCASCHSPDGIELVAYRYDQDDVLRRAAQHLEAPDQAALLAMLLDERKTVGDRLEFDPQRDRPLQPGARVLDSDAAFGDVLKQRLPKLMGKPIQSIADAKAARDELLALDLRDLPVGFAFNRLSEDGFHGEEHATMAQWLPDTPIRLTPEVLKAQDDYLLEPTAARLHALDDAVVRANPVKTATEVFSREKYRSLLVLQHRLRIRAGMATENLAVPLGAGVDANPFWLVADAARVYSRQSAASLGLPSEVSTRKSPDLARQMKAMRVPWFWMGWLEDPALARSGLFPETQTGHYFVTSLVEDGPYPLHALFAVTTRMVRLACAPNAWTYRYPRHFEVQFSALAVTSLLKACPRTPAFEAMLANSFRMSLFLLRDDLQRTGKAIRPESQAGQIRIVAGYLGKLSPADSNLMRDTLAKLEKASRERS